LLLNHISFPTLRQGTPLIYVNFNYRLGPLGFPQGQEGEQISIRVGGTSPYLIPAEERGALNLALKDQLAALEWVQDNIHHFGGDKSKVGAVLVNATYLNDALPGYHLRPKCGVNHDCRTTPEFEYREACSCCGM
jgi:hypothetical protein